MKKRARGRGRARAREEENADREYTEKSMRNADDALKGASKCRRGYYWTTAHVGRHHSLRLTLNAITLCAHKNEN